MLTWPLAIILGVIACIALFVNVRTPGFIGSLGENEVTHRLKRLDKNCYSFLSNVLLPSRNGRIGTSQIDHIVVSTFGVFCIETKTRSGVIVGDADDKDWTQVLSNRTYTFYNPLRQNYGHVRALESVLGHHLKARIISLVALPLAERLELTGTDAVSKVQGTMQKLLSYRAPIYSQEERAVLVRLIEASRIRDRAAYRQHVRQIRSHKI